MTHYLLFKLNGKISNEDFVKRLTPYFEQLNKEIDGFFHFTIKRNVIDRKNNFDILIELSLTKDALENYFVHPLHLQLKEDFKDYISQKAVFDDDTTR